MIENFGESTNIEVIDRLMAVSGLELVDIGCGAGKFARDLAERGAVVVAVEPDPIQAEKNRQVGPVPGVTFVEAAAQALPLGNCSADGVIFCYSLHHVAAAEMDVALGEAIRILRPEPGILCVIEPEMKGSYAELSLHFHDETEVRRLAQEAVARYAIPRFHERHEIRYTQTRCHSSFESFLEEKLGTTYNDHRREAVDTAEVRAAFEAGRAGDHYRFEQPVRVALFRGLRQAS